MRKVYLLAIAFCLVLGSVNGQDTLNLYPPVNLQATMQQSEVLLTWQAPVDLLASSDTIPPGLIGYRIYSDNVLIAFIDHPLLSFIDTEPNTPVNFYKTTAMYDLAAYGFPGDTAESAFSNLANVITDMNNIHNLPFSEDFSSGEFETNLWTAETTHWQIVGSSDPSAKFLNVPFVTNYSSSLTSHWIDGRFIDGKVFVTFNLKQQFNNHTGNDSLLFEVFNGDEWITKASYSDEINSWILNTINITKQVSRSPFKIRFRAEGEDSQNLDAHFIDNIEVFRKCEEPFGLMVERRNITANGCNMELFWADPQAPTTFLWLNWDDGVNASEFGLPDGGTFNVAVRFPPEQLPWFNGLSLTKIKLFPTGGGGSIVLKVWTGANAAQLVHSQPISTYIPNEWNTFDLNTFIPISDTCELWIGYQVIQPDSLFIVGADRGPAVIGYGDMISMDGVNWNSVYQEYGYDLNWNIGGFLTDSEIEKELKSSKSLLGYNVYRDDVFIAHTVLPEYIDVISTSLYYTYNVTAVYEDCESGFSNWYTIDCYCSSINTNDLIDINVLPNPTPDIVTVEYNGNISKLTLFDMMGRAIAGYSPTPGSTSFDISLAKFPDGIYNLRIETTDKRMFGRKIVKRK